MEISIICGIIVAVCIIIYILVQKNRLNITKGGNLTFIASNITAAYCIFRDTPFGKTLSEEQLLCATALCNGSHYLATGELSLDTIKSSVGYALTGTIGNFAYNVSHSGDFALLNNYEDKHLFHVFGLSMQLEYMYFCVDTDFTTKELCDSLISNKKIIESVVKKTYKNPKASPTYSYIHATISRMISDADFRDLVKTYKFGR